MAEDGRVLPDFKDIEIKVGRKVPESLARSLAGGKRHEERPAAAAWRRRGSADVRRLEGKMMLLREEMALLRAIDVKLMQQLMYINEGIESIRWIMEDKGGVASPDGSLAGSLYSLSDSQEGSSTRGSLNSLNDANSDELDGLSVGSYLDTLAEDLPEDPSPTQLDCVVDKTVVDAFSKSSLKQNKAESDEYYCFG